MADFAEYNNMLEQVFSEAAKDFKDFNGFGRLAAPLRGMWTSITNYINDQKPMKIVHRLITTTDCVSEEKVEPLLNICKKYIPLNSTDSDKSASALRTNKVADHCTIKCVSDCIQEKANNALGVTTLFSCFGLGLEVARLWGVWEEIEEANVILQKDFPQKKAGIEEALNKLRNEITNLSTKLAAVKFETMTPDDRCCFVKKNNRVLTKIRRMKDIVHKKIGNLEIQVNGKIERLSVYDKENLSNAVTQGLHGVHDFCNLGLYGGEASRLYSTFSAVVMAGHFALAAWGLSLRKQGKVAIAELRQKLVEIEKLRESLEDLEAKLDEIYVTFVGGDTEEEEAKSDDNL